MAAGEGPFTAGRLWMIATNFAMTAAWARVLVILAAQQMSDDDQNESSCVRNVVPAAKLALGVSFLELLNAVLGVTRSKPAQVLLFSVIRFGVELLVAPLLESCNAWPHVLTVFCWSAGDTVRFSCFLIDNVIGGTLAKTIRYNGPLLLFPLGAVGEMIMVISAALRKEGTGKVGMLVAASLWPLGFYPLFTQLLKQRRKFYKAQTEANKAKSK